MQKQIDDNLAQIEHTLDRCDRAIQKLPACADKNTGLFMISSSRFAIENIQTIVQREIGWTYFMYGLLFVAGLGLGVLL